MYAMYRLLAIAKYEERYVIPTAYAPTGGSVEEPGCALEFDGGPGMYESGPFGEASGRPVPVAITTYSALKQRQQADAAASSEGLHHRAGMLNWDGNGRPQGLFPPSEGEGS